MAIYIGYQKVTGSGGAGGGGEDPSVLMTQAEYDAAYAAGTLSANITYMTPDSGTGGGEIPVASQTAVGGVRVGFNGGSDPDALGNFPVALSGPDAYVGLSALCEKIRKLENLVNGGGEMNLDSLTFDTSQVSVLNRICQGKEQYTIPAGEYLCYPTFLNRDTIKIGVCGITTDYYDSTATGSEFYVRRSKSITLTEPVFSLNNETSGEDVYYKCVRRVIKTVGPLAFYSDYSDVSVCVIPLSACSWPSVGS